MSSSTVIYHRADFDGLFSGAVCKKFLPDAEMIGWDFGDTLIAPPSEGSVYIVDLPPDCLAWNRTPDGGPDFAARKELFERVVWIDHHKSSIEKWAGEPVKGLRIDGVAACRLCWAWFNAEKHDPIHGRLPTKDEFVGRQVKEPIALTIAGEYDVWDLHDPRSQRFQFGLTAENKPGLEWLIPQLETMDAGEHIGGKAQFETGRLCEQGKAAMQWQQAFAEQVCRERRYIREWEGRTFCVLASCHTRNSMWFPADAIPLGCDALMCWRYDGETVSFSLYHRPGFEDLDLSPIAVKYGGGGHKGACGFALPLDQALEIIR